MAFAITITKSFKKRLAKKPPDQAGAVLQCIKKLADNPLHPSLHTHRIQGTRKTWEAYVDGSNRVSWEYGAQNEIIVLSHCSHKAVLGS